MNRQEALNRLSMAYTAKDMDISGCGDPVTKDWLMGCTEALSMGMNALRKEEKNEKAKEEGRLIELPCKPGDIVWLVLESLNKKWTLILSRVNRFITIKDYTYAVCYVPEPLIDYSIEFYLEEFGEKIFTTREAAEKVLAERNAQKGIGA